MVHKLLDDGLKWCVCSTEAVYVPAVDAGARQHSDPLPDHKKCDQQAAQRPTHSCRPPALRSAGSCSTCRGRIAVLQDSRYQASRLLLLAVRGVPCSGDCAWSRPTRCIQGSFFLTRCLMDSPCLLRPAAITPTATATTRRLVSLPPPQQVGWLDRRGCRGAVCSAVTVDAARGKRGANGGSGDCSYDYYSVEQIIMKMLQMCYIDGPPSVNWATPFGASPRKQHPPAGTTTTH